MGRPPVKPVGLAMYRFAILAAALLEHLLAVVLPK
jgi:hypothetical protein